MEVAEELQEFRTLTREFGILEQVAELDVPEWSRQFDLRLTSLRLDSVGERRDQFVHHRGVVEEADYQ